MKSHAKRLLSLCECIYKDIFAQCAIKQVDIKRDLETIRSRVKDEGLSFLTITLPNFCQGIERSLEERKVTHSNFQGWKFTKSLPNFLKGLTSLIFSVATGDILEEPSALSLKLIRQLTLSFKKIQIPCSPERVENALSDFLGLEHELQEYHSNPQTIDIFDKVSSLLWGNIFHDSDEHDYIPRHGPGATEERIYGNSKYVHRIWHERLQPFFPYDQYACFNIDHAIESKDAVSFPDLEHEQPVRVIPVPKTLKGPRIIAIEPVCMQYIQQALSRYIIPKIEKHPITSGHINFKDQNVNKMLAVKSSIDQRLCSIDLSAASDRVPLSLVLRMLKSSPDLMERIYACRSRRANLNGKIINLSKFASMGSALCFPIEAMYFFTVVLTALFWKHKSPVTLREIYKLSRDVYVYGDDIFIPTHMVDCVIETLASYNCKVNRHKSFWKSNFRESCGMDAFNGHNVTPTYVRSMPPNGTGTEHEIISWIETSNQFYLKGYWYTADFMKKLVESKMGTLPIIKETSPALGFVSFQNYTSVHRYNKKLHRPEIHGHVVSPVKRKDKIEGYNAMVKWTLNRLNDIKLDYTSSPRSGTVRIKRRWTTAY